MLLLAYFVSRFFLAAFTEFGEGAKEPALGKSSICSSLFASSQSPVLVVLTEFGEGA